MRSEYAKGGSAFSIPLRGKVFSQRGTREKGKLCLYQSYRARVLRGGKLKLELTSSTAKKEEVGEGEGLGRGSDLAQLRNVKKTLREKKVKNASLKNRVLR